MPRREQGHAATAAGVSVAAISRPEGSDGETEARLGTSRRLRRAFGETGIGFTDGDTPEVRPDPARARAPSTAA